MTLTNSHKVLRPSQRSTSHKNIFICLYLLNFRKFSRNRPVRMNQPHTSRNSLTHSPRLPSLPLLICHRASPLGHLPVVALQLGRTGLRSVRRRCQIQAPLAVATAAVLTAAAGAAKETPRQLALDALPNGRRLACSAAADGTVLAAAAGAGAAVVGTGCRSRGRCGGGCSPVPAPGSFGRQRRGRRSHLRHHHRSQSHGRCCGR